MVNGLAPNIDDIGRPLCPCRFYPDKNTEYLPEGHEALDSYGIIQDPRPEKGRPLRDKAAEPEQERIDRPS
ncbi:MAG: ferredoxin-thioredoxin reductase catalytic domain-containing protein [Dehalococcoidia bacterium]|nr:ferredoxin-thioredoxin reductase catalytic domain-containing protein [Dehalococcoidia bacterium]